MNPEAEIDPPTAQLPQVFRLRETLVRQKFWPKMKQVAARVPFSADAVAAYYCVVDPATPRKPKAILLAALAYFISPIDIIPDFLFGVGYVDDAAVLAYAIREVGRAITEEHRAQAKAWLTSEG